MKKISGFIIAGMILISVIAKIIGMFDIETDMNSNLALVLAFILLVAETCAIPAIVFYADRNKNDSLSPLAGYICIGLYFIIVIAYLVVLKSKATTTFTSTAELNDFYDKMQKYKNFQELAKNLVLVFEYVSIVNLLQFKSLNSKSQMMRVFAYLGAFIFFVLSTVLIWKTEDNTKLQYSVEIAKSAYYLFLALFITFQAMGDGEVLAPATEVPLTNSVQNSIETPASTNQEPIFGNSASGKPKFRNPALEEQEARIAAQKAAQEQMNNQQGMPQGGPQTMSMEQNMMPGQPMPMNQNMMPGQPMPMEQNMMPQQSIEQPQGMPLQGAPMNQPPIDPAMAQPPITNQQYPQ